MKKPVSPPDFERVFASIDSKILPDVFKVSKPEDSKSRYIHWDKLRHLQPPEKLTSEQWWVGIKLARKAIYKPTGGRVYYT